MSAISSIGFTAGGIDVNTIVSGLMTAERTPETVLSDRQAAASLQSQTIGRLRSSLQALQAQASALVTGGISKLGSTVSIPTAVGVSVSSTASTGSLSFTVDALARAHGVRTANTVASSTAVVTTAAALAISSTSSVLGATSIAVGSGATAGQYAVKVTQATSGAAQTGSSPVAASTVITNANQELNIQIDGSARTLMLATGTYPASSLVNAVQQSLDAAGGGAVAALDGTGRIVITSTHEGSAATLAVTGGSAMSALGMTVGSSTGTDGSIQIGTNPPTAVTSAGPGASGAVSVSTGTGTLDVSLGKGLRVGDATVAVVSTGDRSLGAVTAAINNANVGASAAAVKVSDGAWLLQLSSTHAGKDNALSVDSSVFSGVGGLLETTAAQDAKITIGTGPGAYSVTSSTNAFTDVMPGVTINALTESSDAVTVSVARDDSATADQVEKLVTAATSLLSDISVQVKYDPKTNKASPLSGDSAVRAMADQIRAAVTSLVGGGSMTLAGKAGITTKQDGTLAFDRTAFMAAFDTDPAGVERLFGRGGTTTGNATWGAATDNTVAGSYAINVTTAPTRATTGDVLIGGSAGARTIGVRIGTTTASYQVAPGATASDIATGLNHSLAAAGIKVNAEVSGGGVRLTASGFGGAGSFESNLDVGGAGSWSTNTGTDVVGTIDGKAAIGVGNRLSLLDGDTSRARGLGVDIAEGTSGASTVDYSPGIAARLVSLGATLTSTNGALTTSATTYDNRIAAFTKQIDDFEVRMTAKEAQYRRQWTAVQASLASLQNQGSWLSSQIGSLPTTG